MSEGLLRTTSLLAQGPASESNAALVTFALYILAVFVLAWFSNRLLQKKAFLSEYFLGSRSLGVWAFALTFAATSASGGSFTGFPSKIYTYGWVLALWIGSYMVVPVCTMGLLGKRINQIARKTGAITIPDVIRDRFDSAKFGAVAIVLIVFFMSVNLIAQFKAGSLILKTLVQDVPIFHDMVSVAGALTTGGPLDGVEPDYLVCLLTFGVAVVIYTTYGGFHAVVWTDVLQGIVMVIGVMVMLPLALYLVGGLPSATAEMTEMVPPKLGTGTVRLEQPLEGQHVLESGTWFRMPGDSEAEPRYLRTGASAIVFEPGETAETGVDVLELVEPTPRQVAQIEKEIAWQRESRGETAPEVRLEVGEMEAYTYGAGEKAMYVTGPGPGKKNEEMDGFLPLNLAISFFFMWAISGAGQPSNMVRLMAFNRSRTLKRSIFTVSIYYTAIYFPLVVIFCCARLLLPGMDHEPDRIMPAMAVYLTENVGVGWLAGLLVAAPFAAIMSTVDSFLLMISSALVRDVYQRNINPEAQEKQLKRLSFVVTFLVGMGAMLGATNPPQFLQDIIVYTGSGLAACFLIPVALALYWPRVNTAGALAGMVGGFATHLSLYVIGTIQYREFNALKPLGIDPIIWGLGASLAFALVVTRLTPPPPEWLVRRYFYVEKPSGGTPS